MAKNKLKRFAEMETLPNVFQPGYVELYRHDYIYKGKWNAEVFHNNHPIVLEIGCGKGEYTVELGKLYPEKNFIGIDIKGARMWKGAKTALETGMDNVVFIRMYAEMLASAFAPGEISEIWITFPDPQMAKARKRLTGTRFLNLYKQQANHLKADICTDNLYASGLNDTILNIKTFYEKQWLSRGKNIKYIRFTLNNTGLLEEPDIEIERDDYHSEARHMVHKDLNQ